MTREEILNAFPLVEWLQARGVQLTNGGRRAHRCPVKEHSRPDTVSVNATKQVWNCHACYIGGTVIDWLALEKRIGPAEAFKDLAAQMAPADSTDAKPRVVKEYNYTDEAGKLLFQCVRYEPKTFRQRQPDGVGGWTWNLKGVRLVLYRLPEVVKADEAWIVEGERDSDSLAALGFCATCNPMGAGKWRETFNESLRGKRVVIVPDNDEPGRKHAEAVARSVYGIASSVKVLALPEQVGGAAVKDGTEYIGTFQDSATAAERLAMMAEGAPEWTEPPESRLKAAPTGTTPAAKKPPMIQFYKPSEIKAYVIPPETYILGKFIMRGDVVCLAGVPGVGKSRAVTWLAVCGAVGGSWFGLEPSRKFKTLIIQGENGLARLKDEYSLHDCTVLDDWIRVSDVPAFGMSVDDPEFVAQVVAMIKEFRPDLIIIDPFNHIVTDEKYKEQREAIRLVQSIVAASGSQAAVLFVHHLRKGRDGERPRGQRLLDHLAGSYAFGAAMRTVAVLQSASDNTEETRLVFTICKANNAEKPPATAWQRDGARWIADGNFDIANFLHGDSDNVGNRKAVTEDHLAELFENGKRHIARRQAVDQLMELANVKHTAAYDALKTGSGRKFKGLKEDRDGLLVWEPEEGGE